MLQNKIKIRFIKVNPKYTFFVCSYFSRDAQCKKVKKKLILGRNDVP